MKHIYKTIVFFKIKELTEINHTSILSCIFFFKYYFGIIPFFNNYKYLFKLNINYFDFTIEYHFVKNLMYYVIFYFINDVYYMINKIHLNKKDYVNYWEYTITDMNFFIEKKNSLGFFNLKYNLIIQMYSHLNGIGTSPFYLFKIDLK
jgi:hypothetical protein